MGHLHDRRSGHDVAECSGGSPVQLRDTQHLQPVEGVLADAGVLECVLPPASDAARSKQTEIHCTWINCTWIHCTLIHSEDGGVKYVALFA